MSPYVTLDLDEAPLDVAVLSFEVSNTLDRARRREPRKARARFRGNLSALRAGIKLWSFAGYETMRPSDAGCWHVDWIKFHSEDQASLGLVEVLPLTEVLSGGPDA